MRNHGGSGTLPGAEPPPSDTSGAGPRRASPHRPTYAAVDIGTNNCRLLIAQPSTRARERFRVVDAFSRIVRLGEGVGESGVLSEAAMARTLAALRICADKIARRHVEATWAVATEACRRAANGQAFLERARAETGLEIEIIGVEAEAELAVHGCRTLIGWNHANALVFDIGGGSTEVIWAAVPAGGDGPITLHGSTSVPMGVVSLSERYGSAALANGAYEEIVGTLGEVLERFEQEHGIREVIAAGDVQLIGTSGTVTTLAGIHFGLPRYDRRRVDGCYLRTEDAMAVTRRLRGLDREDLSAVPCIGRERADLVVVGCAILEAICRTWPIEVMRVADRGLREGMLHRLMAGSAVPAGRA